MSLRRCLISIRTRNCTICTRALSTRSTGNAKRPTAGIIGQKWHSVAELKCISRLFYFITLHLYLSF